MSTTAASIPTKSGPAVGNVAELGGDALLCGERAGDGQGGQDGEEPPDEHAKARRQVVEDRVRIEPREGGAVVARGGEEGVEYLREAVGTGVVEAAQTGGRRPTAMPAKMRRRDGGGDHHDARP